SIKTGEVGYIATGLKDINKVRVGDTITTKDASAKVDALPGYREPKPMVFANLFPEDADQIRELREAVERYNLTDAAFTFEPINSSILGSGFRCGFLGLLHVDIVRERIAREYGVDTQITTPNVRYEVELRNGQTINVQSAPEMPEPNALTSIKEPWCNVAIYTRNEYIGPLMKISEDHRGEFVDMQYFGGEDGGAAGATRVELTYRMPLAEVISNYFDELKSVSQGYASLDYEITEYKEVDLVKLEVLLNKESHPALARLVVREQAVEIGKKLVEKLKDNLPRQQFRVPIQAAIGGSVIARDDIPAMRKDVTAKLYGGDRTRKDKLLKKQAKGKKRMQEQGRVTIPYKTYQEIIKL
ncbi:elongation factor 4, partial [candidate division WWE3 bacterium]|nr:elongation factor 4 [candidate division WWE3 bacterium]